MNESPALKPKGDRRRTLFRLGGLTIVADLFLLPWFVGLVVVLALSLLPEQVGADEQPHSSLSFWLMGVVGAFLFFACLLARELTNALTARGLGIPVERVSFFPRPPSLDGRDEARTPLAEFLVAAAGPATSLTLGVGAWIAGFLLPQIHAVTPLLRFLAVANLLLGLASLLPALPFDGGRMVRAMLWYVMGTRLEGTRMACLLGRIFAGLLGAGSLASMGILGGLPFWGMALAVVLWLQTGATWRLTRVRERLSGLVASDLMSPPSTPLPRQISVEDALHDPSFGPAQGQERAWLVDFQGRLGGIVTLRALRAVPQEEWPGTPVWEATERLSTELTLTPQTRAEAALGRMTTANLPFLPVLHEGDLVGVLHRDVLMRVVSGEVEPPPSPKISENPPAHEP